ncbi:MAG: aconitase family protein [Ilumatobacteraceae bacterium]
MGAEIGATTSVFGYDHNMAQYLKATGREAIADAADKVADELRPDEALCDELIEIDLDQLKPLSTAPTPPTSPTGPASMVSVRPPVRTAGRSSRRPR